MARLPEVGGDNGQWGQLLNDYLVVAHNSDGTLKTGSVGPSTLQDGSINVAKIATDGSPTSGQALTYDGGGLSWATLSGSGAVPDATDSTKGLVQLAGDLGGTAAAPTVPGLAGKANTTHTHATADITSGTFTSARIPVATSSATGAVQLAGDLGGTAAAPTVPGLAGKEATITAGTTAQYYRGDKSWQTLNKAAVGLANVDNTSDADKPLSTAVTAALSAKANTSHTHAASDVTSGTFASARIPTATSSATGAIQLAGDLGGTAASPTVPGLSGKEATITAGTTAQYFRGDKSWQTLDKAAVGLGNVDNTSDANKPISTATQTALNGKEPTITASGTSSYFRGDKTWQTLNKYSVSLGNVDDTSDANKPVSTATQVALDNKASINHSHAATAITSGTIDTARLPTSSETASGVVELATVAEATTGTDTARAVTPAGVKAVVDTAIAAVQPQVVFVDALNQIPPGTPADTLIVVRAV